MASRRGRGAGQMTTRAKRSRESVVEIDGDVEDPVVTKKSVDSRPRLSAAEAGLSPPPAPSVSPSVPDVLPGCPLDSTLLSSFGGFDRKTVAILEDFFGATMQDGDDDVSRGLLVLSSGLKRAIDSYSALLADFNEKSGQLEQMYHAKSAAEHIRDGVCAENLNLKARLAERDSVANDKISELNACIASRDATIKDLETKLGRANSEAASAFSEFSDYRSQFEQEKSGLETRLRGVEEENVAMRNNADKFASVLAKLSDPVTGIQRRCPLIQNNGVIQSFDSVIGVWVKEQDMGQSHAFRMFTCPVTKSFSMLAPVPIIEAFMKLANAAGVETSLPMVFHYKMIDSGVWTEFSFHEQLELIARLCSVYRERGCSERLPEQRSVSIPGEGSVVILMRSVMMGPNGFKLECFGMRNNGNGKMEMGIAFDPAWTHPFDGMVFPPCGAAV